MSTPEDILAALKARQEGEDVPDTVKAKQGLVTDPRRWPNANEPSYDVTRTTWTPQKLIAEIQRFHAENGRVPSANDFNPALARINGVPERAEAFYADGNRPNITAFVLRFGSWNKAVIAAGFTPNRGGRKKPNADQAETTARRVYHEQVHEAEENKVRNKAMRRRRQFGETYQSIADDYGLTRERVRQLTKNVVVSARPPKFPRLYCDQGCGASRKGTGKDTPDSTYRCMACVNKVGSPLRRYSDEELLQILRDYYAEYGGAPTVYTFSPAHARQGKAEHLDQIVAEYHERRYPTLNTIQNRFGSLPKALAAAGIPPNPKTGKYDRMSSRAGRERAARNEQIIRDQEAGATGKELAEKYNLTPAGIYNIIGRHKLAAPPPPQQKD